MKEITCFLAMLALMSLGCTMQSQSSMFTAAPDSPFRVGSRPADIVVGDVNGDATLDAITANQNDNSVSVLLGNGKGGFAPVPGSPFPAGPAPHLIATGDLNGDGELDLALTSHDSNDVVILLGNGRGRFSTAPDSPVAAVRGTQPHNHGLLLGDVNGDAALDVITANQNDNSISVLLGNGRGGFIPAPGSPFAVGRRPYPPALGDINQDGNPDIVTPNFGSNDVTVLLGNGKGGFTVAPDSPYRVEDLPYFAALGDLDDDRRLDLIITHNDSSLVTIMLGNGKGDFRQAPGSPLDVGRRAWKVRLGDVNRDGSIDLVMDTAGNYVVVLLGDGNGGFRPAPGSPFAAGRGPWGIAIGDVNRDGKLDIVTANSASNDVTLLLGR